MVLVYHGGIATLADEVREVAPAVNDKYKEIVNERITKTTHK